MATMGGGCFVVAGSFTPRTSWFRKSYSLAASTTPITTTTTITTAEHNHNNNVNGEVGIVPLMEDNTDENKRSWRDYFELANIFIRSSNVGPPRWFSPLDSGSNIRLHNSPLLLYLPGIDGVGIGLVLQQQKLGKIFDVWCLHIPVKDRTPFQELVLLVEEAVRSENRRCPERPIYLVGESVGGCLALAVAARNPDIDLVLILANPATCYSKSQLQSLLPLLEVIPTELSMINIPHTLSLMTDFMSTTSTL